MSNCKHCGKKIVKNAKFCKYCGNPLEPEYVMNVHGTKVYSFEGWKRAKDEERSRKLMQELQLLEPEFKKRAEEINKVQKTIAKTILKDIEAEEKKKKKEKRKEAEAEEELKIVWE